MHHNRALLALKLCILTFLFVGCSDNVDDFVVSGNTVEQTGTVQLQLTQARNVRAQAGLVPSGVSMVRIRGLTIDSLLVFGPQDFDVAPTIVIPGVPTSVVQIEGDYLRGSEVVGRFSEPVVVRVGEVVTVSNPTLLPSADGNQNQLAQGTYGLFAFGTDGVPFSGNVELDGAGGISAATLSELRSDGSTPTLGLNASQYNLDVDGRLSGTLDTSDGILSLAGGSSASFVGPQSGVPLMLSPFSAPDSPLTGLAYFVARGSELGLDSLQGKHDMNGHLKAGDQGGFFGGSFRSDGAGNITEATLDSDLLEEVLNLEGPFQLQQTVNYTLDADGDFQTDLDFGSFVFSLRGVRGVDGRICFVALVQDQASGAGAAGEAGEILAPIAARTLQQETEARIVRYVVVLAVSPLGGGGLPEDAASVMRVGLAEIDINSGEFKATFAGNENELEGILGSDQLAIEGKAQFPGALEIEGDPNITINDEATFVPEMHVFNYSVDGQDGEDGVAPSLIGILFSDREEDPRVHFQLHLVREADEDELTPRDIEPELEDEDFDFAPEVDVNRANVSRNFLTVEVMKSPASTQTITGFHILAADNPQINFSELGSCTASILDPITFSTLASFDSISINPDGGCSFQSNQPLPSDALVFLDFPRLVPGSNDSVAQAIGGEFMTRVERPEDSGEELEDFPFLNTPLSGDDDAIVP